MLVHFERYVTNDESVYEHLLYIYKYVSECSKEEIILDFTKTKVFECNLLALVYLIVDIANERNIPLKLVTNDNKIYYGYAGMYKLFNYHSNRHYRKSFFKPRCIIGNSNNKEIEDLLTKFLYDLNLKDGSKIQILISELIANIKMHVLNSIYCKGFMSSYVSEKEMDLYITIVNSGKSIKNILKDNSMEFNSDKEAIFWTLKKTNSTRKDDESGGLGLYLLRKYINELSGDVTICSGNVYMFLAGGGYNFKDENFIEVERMDTLTTYFDGTIITLRIPYKEIDYLEECDLTDEVEMDLINLLEE